MAGEARQGAVLTTLGLGIGGWGAEQGMAEGRVVSSYRDLEVWRGGMDFAAEVYRLTKLMPKAEEYRLISQLLRAAASVPANIAEGHARGSRKEYAQFISIARGSLAEAETLLLLAVRAELLSRQSVAHSFAVADRLGRQLNVLRRRLASPPAPQPSPKCPVPP
jgi:four helix bundle protein